MLKIIKHCAILKNVNDYRKRLHTEVISITIEDVAREAGVSVATVSRVLNGSGSVRPKTAELVMAKVEELGYRPNLLGRHLRKNETKTILVVTATIANTLIAKVIGGIEETGIKAGYSILIGTTNDDREREKAHINLLKNRFADGIIFLNSVMSKEEMMSLGKHYSVIQCCEYVADTEVPCVAIDNKQAAYDIVNHLIKSGRQRIAYIGVKNHLVSSHERYMGYVTALNDAGIRVDNQLIADGNYGFRSAVRITKDLLERGEKPDAIFAISDRMAAGAIRAAKDNGFCVPQDIAVAGFDNTDISYISELGITTVSQSPSQMGEEAMRLMIRRLKDDKRINNIVINHKMIIRRSTEK